MFFFLSGSEEHKRIFFYQKFPKLPKLFYVTTFVLFKVYGVEDRIEFICCDFFHFAAKWTENVGKHAEVSILVFKYSKRNK